MGNEGKPSAAMATGQKRNDATAQGCSIATEDGGIPDITLSAVV